MTVQKIALLTLIASLAFGAGDVVAQPARDPQSTLQTPIAGRGHWTSDKVKTWTSERWNAARKHWADDNAKFYACSNQWRASNGGARYTFHDQREFIFRCMNAA